MKSICLVLITFLLLGCATSGKRIEADKLKQIKEGLSTKDQVIAIFGKPNTITLNSDKKTIMTYYHIKATNKIANFIPGLDLLAGGVNMDQQTLQVLLNEENIVEKYMLNDSQDSLNTGLLNQK